VRPAEIRRVGQEGIRQQADDLAERLAARVSAGGRPPVEEASLSAR
jgi:hypothetical protein